MAAQGLLPWAMPADFEEIGGLTGLSEAEAAQRLREQGANELPGERRHGLLHLVLGVLREPMFLLLLGCGTIYLLLGDAGEAFTLLGFVVIIIAITVLQERRTERALEALQDLSSPRALVVRGGERRRVAGRDVVEGDLLLLSEGDRVPADAQLLSVRNLTAGDVLAAIAMIRRADQVLGTDHSVFVARALRGFQGTAADPRGLVPYSASAPAGKPTSSTRGCGNSYVSLFAPEIWPEQARKWYDLYGQHFWQETWTGAGFREFPKDLPDRDWYFDVDAGPVIKGYGFAACAFGAGAARVNGHMEHAYPLTAEMLVTAWPLPNGTRLLPALLSDATDAPLLGEAAILFNLTRLPASGVSITPGGSSATSSP